MIQRLQSIFLFLVFTLSVSLFFLPIFEFTLFNSTSGFYITTLDTWVMYIPLILNCIVTLLALICIFLFRNRKLQMKMCNYILIDSAIITLVFVGIIIMAAKDTLTVSYKPTLLFPVLNLILAFAAKKYIKKDDDLVRSADRIR